MQYPSDGRLLQQRQGNHNNNNKMTPPKQPISKLVERFWPHHAHPGAGVDDDGGDTIDADDGNVDESTLRVTRYLGHFDVDKVQLKKSPLGGWTCTFDDEDPTENDTEHSGSGWDGVDDVGIVVTEESTIRRPVPTTHTNRGDDDDGGGLPRQRSEPQLSPCARTDFTRSLFSFRGFSSMRFKTGSS